ncbi:hypothetical protein BCR34DRAFT_71045 [Clohesyomyces aquaticus]|uniref:Uncharacterized protein n=1 Tax=Clohesyomyces aquaticus TaxID=1231657 RepID=A0A1Y1YZD2_9PLEO|nr:hypothetical protein BCR34DRAFT_71045 [Clohesyomyces aquaticus]
MKNRWVKLSHALARCCDGLQSGQERSCSLRDSKFSAEPGFKIYGFCAPTISAPLAAFKGLILSCRQIHDEFEDACVKMRARAVLRLQQR